MKTDLSAASIYTDFAGLARLRAEARKDSPAALRAVAQQFEALFLQMVLKSMRDASLGDGLFESDQTKFYRGLFDQQLATTLSTQGLGLGLGLAELLVRQLGGERSASGTQESASTGRQSVTESASPGGPVNSRFANGEPRTPPPGPGPPVPESRITGHESTALDGSPETFVQTLWPHAQRAGRSLGVVPEVLMAQAALETGWGRAVIQHPDGRSTHNLFGIKADDAWRGARAAVASLEYVDGTMVRRRSAFRSYGSFAESFADYVDLLRSNPRYAPALNKADDPMAFSEALQEAGYATDPAYARKIQAIVSSTTLGDALASVKA